MVSYSRFRRLGCLAPVLLAAMTACLSTAPTDPASPPPYVEDPTAAIPSGSAAEFTSDGLVRVPSDELRGARLYVRPPRPHLQRFDKMILERPVIEYKKGVRDWTGRKEDDLRGRFRRELLTTLSSEDFWVESRELSPSTVIIRATIADFDPHETGDDSTGSSTSFVNAGGGAVLGFELFDPESRKPLMRYVERYQLPGGVYSGTNVDEQRVQVVMARFARRIGTVLRLQYRVVKDIGERERSTTRE